MSNEREAHDTHQRNLRRVAALGAGAIGLAAYNWWLVVIFVPRMVHTTNGFFSDFAAQGEPHASALQALDLLGGVMLLIALLLSRRPRGEWPWLVAWAAAAAIGGRYPYACAADVSRACARLELHRQLPTHHYIHMLAGITEFGTATMAIWRARARIHDIDLDRAAAGEAPVADPMARLADRCWRVLVVGYPLLALAFFTGRGGVLVEPVFFACFSVTAAAYLRTASAADAPVGEGILRRFLREPGATIASR